MADGTGLAFAPRVPSGSLPRKRLLARIDELAASPLVVVRAPAGAGKSTLLAAWATRSAARGVWVALDQTESTRLAFWSRVVGSLVDADALPAMSGLRELTVSSEIGDALRGLLLRGFASLPAALVIVLDDYQNVLDDAVHDDIHWLLSSGARVDLVLATRTTTPFEQPEWRARVATGVLAGADLAFDRDETRAVAAAAGFEANDADVLHDEFDGWPLAVQTALVAAESRPGQPLATTLEQLRVSGPAGFAQDTDDSPYLDFLMRVSVSARLSAESARALGGDDADAFLVRAEREGAGMWMTGAAGARSFAIQPLLRMHLRDELTRRHPDELPALLSRYAADLAEQGEPLEAIRQYAAAGDWPAASVVLRRTYTDLLRVNGRELNAILASADPAELRREPVLLALHLALDSARGRLSRTALVHRASLGIALAQARLGSRDPVERISLLYALMGAQRLGGHFAAARATAEQMVAALATLDEPAQQALAGLRSSAWLQAGTTFFYESDHARADDLYRRAEETAEADGQPWVGMHAASMRLLVVAMHGDQRRLEGRLVEARDRTVPGGWRGTYSAAGFHLAEAYGALERFDVTEARAQLEELAPHEATIEHWPLIARLRGLSAIVAGEPYLGLERLMADIAAHDDRAATSDEAEALLSATRAELLLAGGEPHRAVRALRAAGRSPLVAIAQARADLALGRYERAIASTAGIPWSETAGVRQRTEALLVCAVAARRLGREDEARTAVSRALELLESSGLRRPLMSVPRGDLAALLDLAGADPGLLDGVPDVVASLDPANLLSPSEVRVLEALRDSSRIEDLADALYLSVNTVKSHLRTIYRKLGVTSRDEALAVAALRGLIETD